MKNRMQNLKECDYKRIIAVGDLHGHCEPLEKLLEKINLEEDDLLIFIGDYIDRGPASARVIDTLVDLRDRYKNFLFLKGNHEDMMLGSLGFPACVNDLNTWLYNGGGFTLKSYEIGMDELGKLGSVWSKEERKELLMRFVPETHINFLLELYLYIETENFFFCHAGINPSVSIAQGKRNVLDLLWMREHIYSESLPWEKTVVCGHTPLKDVLIRTRLICIDTGLFYYGKLSAIDVLNKEVFSVNR